MVWMGTGGYPDWKRARLISALISSQASREQVVEAFGEPLIDYSRTSALRGEFQQWLNQTADSCRSGVRERAARYPTVLYHTTAWTMTWLFFDDHGVLRAYCRCTQ